MAPEDDLLRAVREEFKENEDLLDLQLLALCLLLLRRRGAVPVMAHHSRATPALDSLLPLTLCPIAAD
jgi:hypothetical protein